MRLIRIIVYTILVYAGAFWGWVTPIIAFAFLSVGAGAMWLVNIILFPFLVGNTIASTFFGALFNGSVFELSRAFSVVIGALTLPLCFYLLGKLKSIINT